MSRLAVGLVALALALPACNAGLGDAVPCAPGHARGSGGCVADTATIAIDGNVADWAALPVIPFAASCTHAPCDGLLAASLQLAIESCTDCHPALYLRVQLAGGAAPVSDPDVGYVVDIASTTERPVFETDEFVLSASTMQLTKNGYVVVAGSPPLAAYTADGYELAIPTAILPFRGAAIISAHAARGTTAVTDAPAASACWTADPQRADPCAAEPPGAP